jgi:hypothetical protein
MDGSMGSNQQREEEEEGSSFHFFGVGRVRSRGNLILHGFDLCVAFQG